MAESTGIADPSLPPRPLPATYWVLPGRLLAGEHPGSRSRADAMDRLRRVLASGVTYFVDLTEPAELPSYQALLPLATPAGRQIEYLREPIRDHGVPDSHDVMSRVVAAIDDALAAGHVVYLHCRAGIGRSATVIACWLASRGGTAANALEQLHELWQQSARSAAWPVVPETEEQEAFVRAWVGRGVAVHDSVAAPAGGLPAAERIRGALLGLALGDATGRASGGTPGTAQEWTQHTALALCLAESLLATGACDARDQMERFLRWQRDGHLSASGQPGQATPDVARALATYQWRRLPMAGSHDPSDRTTAALPRVVSAVAFALADPAAAVSLAVECARTTHQSPLVLDACRYYAALLVGAMRGAASGELLERLYEPVPGLWAMQPLKAEIVAAATAPLAARSRRNTDPAPDVALAIANVRAAVAGSATVTDAIRSAVATGQEPSLDGALAGTLAGALRGAAALPAQALAGLARVELLEQCAARLAERQHVRSVAGTGVRP